MKDIVEGYKQMIRALIGLVAISPLITITVALGTVVAKYLWKLILMIW